MGRASLQLWSVRVCILPENAYHYLFLCKNSSPVDKTPDIYGAILKPSLWPVLTNRLHSDQLQLQRTQNGISANTMKSSVLTERQKPSLFVSFHKFRRLKSRVVLLP